MLSLAGLIVSDLVASEYVVASPKVVAGMVGGGLPHPSQNKLVTNAGLLGGWVVCG